MAESLITPAILPQTIAENGDATVIPATNDQTEGKASIAYGFPPLTSTPIADGGKMVRRADFNGLFNLLSQYAMFTQNGGLFTFNQSVSDAIGGYPLGAVLSYTDGDGINWLVKSLIPNNTYNFNSDATYIDDAKWKKILLHGVTAAEGTNTTQNATTAFVRSEWAALLEGEFSNNNGWVYLGNNIALQFTRALNISSTTNGIKVTLPKAFDNSNYRVIATLDSTSENTSLPNTPVIVHNHSTSYFYARLGSGTNLPVSFIAIGKVTVANRP